MTDTGGIPAMSRQMYGGILEPETIEKIESLDVGDQAYFWTWLYYHIRRRNGRKWLEDLERVAKSRVTEIDELAESPVEATKPHGWFKVRICP